MVVNFAAVDINEKLNCTVLITFLCHLAILSFLKYKDFILCQYFIILWSFVQLEVDFFLQLLDAVSDCMAFGALEKCPECKAGQLVYRFVVHIVYFYVFIHIFNK